MSSRQEMERKVHKTGGIFRGPRTLAIMPTFRCVANCASCGTLSSPLDKTELTLREMSRCIQEAKRLNFANIVFTGGEPTLCWTKLLKAIRKTKESGLLTRLVTNAHWAGTPNEAQRTVCALRAAGLDEINFSTGDEHARFIPMTNVVNAIAASVANHFRPAVMVEDRLGQVVTKKKMLHNQKIRALLLKDKTCLTISDSPWMPLDPLRREKYQRSCVANKDNLDAYTSCDTILQSLTLMSDGNITACCGFGTRLIPELIVSNINQPGFLARAIESTENDFLKVWLHYEGPLKILDWAARKNLDIQWENIYAHCCQACLRIYRDPIVQETVKANYREKIGQVLSSAWMEEVFIPTHFRGVGKELSI
jgi:organic radical activating enzyme